MQATQIHIKDSFIQYGSTASEAAFDYPCNFFQIAACTGAIAYRVEFKCALVIGDPLCPEKEILPLTKAFHKYCQELNLNIIYITVSEKFAKTLKSFCKISINVCQELIINPALDACLVHSKLRHRVEKAATHGITIHEYIPDPVDTELETILKNIGIKWHQAIKGPHIYLGHLDFFENYNGTRWFYAKDGEQITSMLMLRRIEPHDGWLLKFLVTLPEAFMGTSEFLMQSVLGILQNENCHFLTKGMVPVDRLSEIYGLGIFSKFIAKMTYRLISRIFRFKLRKKYWLKYNPTLTPAYLLFCRSKIGVNEIRALMTVFRTDRP